MKQTQNTVPIKPILRYPGGKWRLGKSINQYIQEYFPRCVEEKWICLDLFTGGGGSLLRMAQQFPKWKFVINDIDPDLINLWKIISSWQSATKLCLKILSVRDVDLDLFYKVRDSNPDDPVERAFKIILLNKCSFNGIISKGRPIGGKKQDGKYRVNEYWKPERISENIDSAMLLLRDRIVGFNSVDYIQMLDLASNVDICYADPPYIRYGQELYGHEWNMGHFRILARKLKVLSRAVVSIDDSPEIREALEGFSILNLPTNYSGRSRHIKTHSKLKDTEILATYPIPGTTK